MSLFRREKRAWTAEPFIPPFPGARFSNGGSGGAPTMDQALGVSAVWACVRLLADTVSMMPLNAYTMASGVRVPIPNPPLLVRPSADASTPDWIYMTMVSMLLRGNAYGHITRRDSYGYPMQIEMLSPDDVTPKQDRETGALTFTVNHHEIPKADIWHVPAYRLPGLGVGLSPIRYAANSISTDAAIAEFALGYFQDAPHPSSVLTTEQPINQESARTIKERLIASVAGREPLILGAGLKFDTLSVSPEESQFLATQKFGLGQIARIYGIPPEMVGGEAGNSMSYSNREQRAYDFLTYGVQSWLTRLEAAVAALMPGNKHARFDTSVLTRTDLETRIKAGAVAIASKQMDPDEVRAWSDYAPLTDEQKKWLDIIPLDVSAAGAPKGTMPAAAAPADPLPDNVISMTGRSLPDLSELFARADIQRVAPAPPSVTVNVDNHPSEPPVVNVETRDMPAPLVTVNVEPTPVTIDVQPAELTVLPTEPKTRKIERDASGEITAVHEE